MKPIFHLAFAVKNIPDAKKFYANGLGCEVGRENNHSAIFNLYGHQVIAHVTKKHLPPQKSIYPRHFGLVFTNETEWEKILERAKQQNLNFYQQPKLRFPNQLTEHRTFFLQDPFDNLLEFKFYRHFEGIFEANNLHQIGDE